MIDILNKLISLSNKLDELGYYKIAQDVDEVLIKNAETPEHKIKDRFWKKVNKTDDCWLWTGAKDSGGYGMATINRKNRNSHRLSWEWQNNKPIPDGYVLLHTCNTPSCVNPSHLILGTQLENIADMVNKNRSAKGTRNGRARLKEEDIKKIRQLRQKGWSEGRIAKLFGVGRSTITHILRSHTWGWI